MDLKKKVPALLREFRDCFAWDYNKMPRLYQILVENKLPIRVSPLSITTIKDVEGSKTQGERRDSKG